MCERDIAALPSLSSSLSAGRLAPAFPSWQGQHIPAALCSPCAAVLPAASALRGSSQAPVPFSAMSLCPQGSPVARAVPMWAGMAGGGRAVQPRSSSVAPVLGLGGLTDTC